MHSHSSITALRKKQQLGKKGVREDTTMDRHSRNLQKGRRLSFPSVIKFTEEVEGYAHVEQVDGGMRQGRVNSSRCFSILFLFLVLTTSLASPAYPVRCPIHSLVFVCPLAVVKVSGSHLPQHQPRLLC